MCNLTLEGSPRYRSGSCAICTGPSILYNVQLMLFKDSLCLVAGASHRRSVLYVMLVILLITRARSAVCVRYVSRVRIMNHAGLTVVHNRIYPRLV